MAEPGEAAARFAMLARTLREAGEHGIRKELYQALSDAAKPITREVKDPAHLKPYFPDRYAETLAADLAVTTTKRTGRDPGVSIRAKGRVKGRHVVRLNSGMLTHPFFGDRERWYAQGKAVRPGFFTDVTDKAGPGVRAEIEKAISRVEASITSGS